MQALKVLTTRLRVEALRLERQALELKQIWSATADLGFGVPREAVPGEKKEAGPTKSPSPEGVHGIQPHISEPRFSSVPPPADGPCLTLPVKRHATDTHKAAPIYFENETKDFRGLGYPEDAP
jgi:hypothetical protein